MLNLVIQLCYWSYTKLYLVTLFCYGVKFHLLTLFYSSHFRQHPNMIQNSQLWFPTFRSSCWLSTFLTYIQSKLSHSSLIRFNWPKYEIYLISSIKTKILLYLKLIWPRLGINFSGPAAQWFSIQAADFELLICALAKKPWNQETEEREREKDTPPPETERIKNINPE